MVTPPKQNSACMAETAETPVQSPPCEKKSQLANNYGFCCSRLAVGVGLDSESATFFGSHADRPSHFKALALIEDSSWLQPPCDPLKCIKIKPYSHCMTLSLCILVEIRKLAWLGVSIPLWREDDSNRSNSGGAKSLLSAAPDLPTPFIFLPVLANHIDICLLYLVGRGDVARLSLSNFR